MVSIVIVSMNKLNNLDICLPSIEKYTTIPHKVYVVAYMFSEENLRLLRERYPYVIVIESNEIRGFSENNNLALKQITTPYIFVQNDDTEFKEPVLDKLLESLKKTPNASVMSPVLQRGDGTIQFSGRRKYTFRSFVFEQLGWRLHTKSKYESKSGIFKTYNISGAAFLISTELFRNMGFFDEKYFFSPEDIVLSTNLNKLGHYCYVDSNTTIIHYEGVSSKKGKLFYATVSAAQLGVSYFFGNTKLKRCILLLLWKFKNLYFILNYKLNPMKHYYDYKYIYNTIYNAYKANKSTKDLFLEEYRKVCMSESIQNGIVK